MSKKKVTDVLVIGFALFSMFFGAGNVIFPPYLGLLSGPKWLLSFLSYYLADIGLAVLAIYALLRNGGNENAIIGKLGDKQGKILMSVIILCVGPLLAIPRTAAATYEMSIVPIFGGGKYSALITSLVYFTIIFMLSVKESKVVDIVGKFLTPTLLIGLLFLIIKGALFPLGEISARPMVDTVVTMGVQSGYQTMDVLAALAFGMIILQSAEDKGYKKTKDKFFVVSAASIVAAVALFIVYGGLAYLGATSSTIFDASIGRSELVMTITSMLLGNLGVVLLGIIVALACITTATSLVSASANYFSKLSGGKIKYETIAIIVIISSTIISNFGLNQIIAFASPILSVVYPGALSLIILSFFPNWIKNPNTYKGATLGATLISLLEVLNGFGLGFGVISKLPLSELGFAWVIPSAITAIIGSFIKPNALKHKQVEKSL